MRVSDFSFRLPDELIANYPTAERTGSRLMIVGENKIEHTLFSRLTEYLDPGDLLVLNNTRVIPARLFGHKETGGKVEILVERILNNTAIKAQVKASKAPQPGTKILLNDDTAVHVQERQGQWFILNWESKESIISALESLGHIPLPPYINRKDLPEDRERYQTVFSEKPGAVAAPTAGLHFDLRLLQQLKAYGIETAFLTLHIGAGTYQPVKVENVSDHKMHSEYICVPEKLVEQVYKTKAAGCSVVAVGTTSARSLEAASSCGELRPYSGETDIFIYPGYEFKTVDKLITNFHLPESTLIMMVSAFAGTEKVMQAYQQAIRERYRFFSYGDAMLLNKSH